jgi:hypothetical protein
MVAPAQTGDKELIVEEVERLGRQSAKMPNPCRSHPNRREPSASRSVCKTVLGVSTRFRMTRDIKQGLAREPLE